MGARFEDGPTRGNGLPLAQAKPRIRKNPCRFSSKSFGDLPGIGYSYPCWAVDLFNRGKFSAYNPFTNNALEKTAMSVGFIAIIIVGLGCLVVVGLIIAAIILLTQKDL